MLHASKRLDGTVCGQEVMAHNCNKTEMKGDTSRWCRRAEAKSASKKKRRDNDKREARAPR